MSYPLTLPQQRKCDKWQHTCCFFGPAITRVFVVYKNGQEWSYLRGGLTTVDRDYGWINNIHHDIGTHVIHHLFPQIPHYHLVEAVYFTIITHLKRMQLVHLFYLLEVSHFQLHDCNVLSIFKPCFHTYFV